MLGLKPVLQYNKASWKLRIFTGERGFNLRQQSNHRITFQTKTETRNMTRQTKWHQINIKLTSFLECLTSVWHNKKTSNWRQNEPLLTSIWCHFVKSKWRQISLNYVNLMFVWCQFDVCLMSFRMFLVCRVATPERRNYLHLKLKTFTNCCNLFWTIHLLWCSISMFYIQFN